MLKRPLHLILIKYSHSRVKGDKNPAQMHLARASRSTAPVSFGAAVSDIAGGGFESVLLIDVSPLMLRRGAAVGKVIEFVAGSSFSIAKAFLSSVWPIRFITPGFILLALQNSGNTME